MPDFDRRDDEAAQVYDEMEKLFVKLVQDFGETVKSASVTERARWYALTRTDVCNRFNFLIEQVQ